MNAGAHADLRDRIEAAFERRAELDAAALAALQPDIEAAIGLLESGSARVAEPDGNGGWQVNAWLKKAVLLYFRTHDMQVMEGAPAPYWDKIPMRFEDFDEAAFRNLGARVLPGAIARRGAHIGRDVVLVAIGRRPYTDGLGLESVGVTPDKRGFIDKDRLDLSERQAVEYWMKRWGVTRDQITAAHRKVGRMTKDIAAELGKKR